MLADRKNRTLIDLVEKCGKTFDCVVVDEGSVPAGSKIPLYGYVSSIATRQRLFLTSAPITNVIPDLFALMNVLLPKAFSSVKKFVDLIQLTESFVKGHYVDHSNSLAMIHNVLRPFILRRTHAVLDRSPSARMQQFVVPVDLSSQQRQMYNRIQSSKKIPIVQPDGSAKLKIIKNVFPELRKVCCHPDLIFKDLQSSSEHCIGKSPKFDLFLDMVLKLHNAGRKVLVLSTMTVFLQFTSDILKEQQIHHYVVTGSVPIDDRTKFASEFTTGASANIFLMGTRVYGGSRLDLKGTDAIIFYDCDWNPQIDLQIQNRVRHIGHTSSVKVFYFVAVDTIEEHLFAAREWRLKSTSVSAAILAVDRSAASRESSSAPSIDRKSLLKNAVKGQGASLNIKSSAISEDVISMLVQTYQIESQQVNFQEGLIPVWPKFVNDWLQGKLDDADDFAHQLRNVSISSGSFWDDVDNSIVGNLIFLNQI